MKENGHNNKTNKNAVGLCIPKFVLFHLCNSKIMHLSILILEPRTSGIKVNYSVH